VRVACSVYPRTRRALRHATDGGGGCRSPTEPKCHSRRSRAPRLGGRQHQPRSPQDGAWNPSPKYPRDGEELSASSTPVATRVPALVFEEHSPTRVLLRPPLSSAAANPQLSLRPSRPLVGGGQR
jgi:hypothetical protein